MRGTWIGDLLLAAMVIAITAMLVVPLPTSVIDVLIVLNLSVALILLLVGLYMPNSLALLAFPTLLLLTTLFRLSLNVASSRLILSQGDAGDVIEAFGRFLIRGEIVVGIIIFTIVTIVNFIVIAKGSARVSEVSARFVLDALPGKQMAIDSDLRTGIISVEQARQKREDLRKESQLYGAMDGAMKFVQGDAVAGIFITFANILGGLYQGLASGMELSDAVQTYTVLTVGDGLVSQIPALLISICAGIVVTRVSSSDYATLGADIGSQLFARPGAIIFAGGLLAVLGLLPYLPFLPFMGVGFALIATGLLLQRRRRAAAPDESDAALPYLPRGLPVPAGGEDAVIGGQSGERVVIELDAGMLFRLYRMNAARYSAWWRELSADFYHNWGLEFPGADVVENSMLGAATYRVTFRGIDIDAGNVLLDHVLLELHPRHAAALGLEVLQVVNHPCNGSKVFWTHQSPALRRIAETSQLRTYDFFEYIGLKVAFYFQRHPEDLMSTAMVYDKLKALEKRHPGLMTEALGRHFLTVPKLTQVMHELVRQGMSVRDFGGVVEAIAEFCSVHRVSPQDETDVALEALVDHVRIQRRRFLIPQLISARGTVRVFDLSPEVESVFEESDVDIRGNTIALSPQRFELLQKGIDGLFDSVRERGVLPVAVLASSEIRSKVRLFLNACGIQLQAISVEELEPSMKLERVAVWEMRAT